MIVRVSPFQVYLAREDIQDFFSTGPNNTQFQAWLDKLMRGNDRIDVGKLLEYVYEHPEHL